MRLVHDGALGLGQGFGSVQPISPEPQNFGDVIEECRRHLPTVLRTMLAATQAPGLLGEASDYQLTGQAKRFRARLALASGELLEVSTDVTIKVAAACELLHEASLVHDDLQDRDAMRRGRQSIWARYGDELAITLGDWFINQAYDVLFSMDVSADISRSLARLLSQSVAQTIRGQAKENTDKAKLDLDSGAYFAMAAGKTAPLISFPLEAVSLLAQRSSTEQATIRQAIYLFGGAYQLRDDLLDLSAGKGREKAGADLVEGKATLPVLFYYQQAGELERHKLKVFLSQSRDGRNACASEWVNKIVDSGALGQTQAVVDRAIDEANRHIATLPSDFGQFVHRTFTQLLTKPSVNTGVGQ